MMEKNESTVRYPKVKVSNKKLIKGGTTTKYSVDVNFSPFNNKTMVMRNIDYPSLYKGKLSSSEYYCLLWKTAKDAGLPVLEEVVPIDDNTIVETHLTSAGGKIYGKDTVLDGDPTEKVFKEMDLSVVEDEVLGIVLKAQEAKILLSYDHAFDLYLDKKSRPKVYVRDIKNTGIGVQHDTYNENLERAQRFISRLKSIQSLLSR